MQMPLAQSYLFTSDAQCTKAVVLLGVEAYPALQLAPRDLRGWHVELTSLQYLHTSDIQHKLGANVRGRGQYRPNLHMGPVLSLQRLPMSQNRRLEQPSSPFHPSTVKHPLASPLHKDSNADAVTTNKTKRMEHVDRNKQHCLVLHM